MPTIIKPNNYEYRNDPSSLEQFDLFTLFPRLTKVAGSKHFAFDLRKLEPGKYSFPYHFHRNAEELIMVLSGSMTLRTPEGFQKITQGQLVFFEIGETGAHQFYNHGAEPCTYLDFRTTIGLDVCEYPDSGKVNIIPVIELYEKHTRVEYNKGEENVQAVWDKLKNEKNK